MIYEWMWCKGELIQYVAWALIGVTVMGGLFIRACMSSKPDGTPPMIWFLLAALVCAMFYSALGRAGQYSPPHVRMMPMYPILFLDFFLSGCYTWWRKMTQKHK